MKWSDAYDGHGEYYFDYNHGSAYKEPAPYAPAPPAYSPPAPYAPAPPAYSPPVPAYA